MTFLALVLLFYLDLTNRKFAYKNYDKTYTKTLKFIKYKMFKLSLLNIGDTGEIIRINNRPCKKTQDCDESERNAGGIAKDLGLRVGKHVRILQKQGKGPILVKIDDMRIAIGKKLADRIQVA